MRIGRVVSRAPKRPDSPSPGSHLRAPSAVSLNLLHNQLAHLKDLSVDFLNNGVKTNLRIKRQLNHCMRARQLISIHLNELHLRKEGES
eukprot:641563-Pelagomonas_calceolata.AAC.1